MANPPSSYAAVFNMSLAILGPGVLSIPYALSNSGLALGTALVVGSAVLNTYSIEVLIRCAQLLPPSDRTFTGIATATFGAKMAYFVDVNVAFYLLGCICGNLVAISTLGARFAHYLGWSAVTENATLLACTICVLPLCLVRDLSHLGAFVSPIGVAALCSVVVCIAALFFRAVSRSDEIHASAIRTSDDVLFAFPIATFAFSAQPYVFALFFDPQCGSRSAGVSAPHEEPLNTTSEPLEPLKEAMTAEPEAESADCSDPDANQLVDDEHMAYMKRVTRTSMAVSLCVYLGVGYFGVLQFGVDTNSDILLNYDKGDALPATMAGVMAVAVMICLPINLHPLRERIDVLAPSGLSDGVRFVGLTVGILAIASGLSVMIPNLGEVFDLTGATGCMFLCYLFPCLFISKIEGSWHQMSILTVAIGVSCSVISLWKIVPELVD